VACEKLLDGLSKTEQAKAEKSALSTAKFLWNFLTGMAGKHNIPMQVAA
jgi:pyrroloquinoline-quinone synthase